MIYIRTGKAHQAVLGNQIDFATKSVFQIAHHTKVFKTYNRSRIIQRNQQIDIAVRTLIATGTRAEQVGSLDRLSSKIRMYLRNHGLYFRTGRKSIYDLVIYKFLNAKIRKKMTFANKY